MTHGRVSFLLMVPEGQDPIMAEKLAVFAVGAGNLKITLQEVESEL